MEKGSLWLRVIHPSKLAQQFQITSIKLLIICLQLKLRSKNKQSLFAPAPDVTRINSGAK